MIYSEEFVWLHFPKCAGTKVENLFRKYFSSNLELTQDVPNIKIDPSITWHDSIAKRESRDSSFRLGIRDVIVPVRKLPAWLESRYSYEITRNPTLQHDPKLILEGKFLEANGYKNNADFYMKYYLPSSLLESNNVRFLRTEFFESDFKLIFSDYIDISVIPDNEYKIKENTSDRVLLEEIRTKLYDGTVYKYCPYWSSIEKIAYAILN